MGITPASMAQDLAAGRTKGWVGSWESRIVGFCMGESASGEVLVLAVLPEYEGRGVGKTLLSLAVEWLRSFHPTRVWLSTSPNPDTRAYGFYRALGWRPIGEIATNGDEILVLAKTVPAESPD
jgi:ribosomal protein S18 acetylase RimI-like enzyme